MSNNLFFGGVLVGGFTCCDRGNTCWPHILVGMYRGKVKNGGLRTELEGENAGLRSELERERNLSGGLRSETDC